MNKLFGKSGWLTILIISLCVVSMPAVLSGCSDDPEEELLPPVVDPEEPENPDKPDPEDPDEPENPDEPQLDIVITLPESVTVSRRESCETAVTLSGYGDVMPEWYCTSSNPSVATVSRKDAATMVVTGVSAGAATVTVAVDAGEKKFEASVPVTVEQGALKILAIGNSFSQDAVEQYLYELGHSAGVEMIIGNMYIGGCELDKHWANMQSDAAAYEYRKVVDGKKNTRKSVKLSEALADENWDYISLQQASGKSGKYETYTALPQLIQSISATAPEATLMWHQTWAYASGSTHESFPAYGRDQMTMYRAIVAASRSAMNDNAALKLLIPSGTAIQNARTAYVGDVFNRDGYHLEVTYGRYTAACTWFETLTGIDVTGVTYAPSTVSAEMGAIARAAAHKAVLRPDEVTVLEEYANPAIKEGDITTPIFIDFGPTSLASEPWNNITSYEANNKNWLLKDTNGDFVEAGLIILGGFTGNYPGVSGESNHTAFTAAGIEFPVNAWKDGLVVAGTKGGGNVGPGRLALTNLNPAASYDVTILSVRFNGSRSARETSFQLSGKTTSDAKNIKQGMKIGGSGSGVYPNFTSVPFEEYAVTFAGVTPANDGTITVSVTGIDTGTAAEGHINALVLAPAR